MQSAFLRAIATTLALCAAVEPAGAQGPLDTVTGATVTLTMQSAEGSSTGSGVIATAEGVIFTAAHVIVGATEGVVRLASGEEFLIEGVLAVDVQRDFALIRIAGFGLQAATLAGSQEVAVGDRVLAVGAPLGLEATVADGLVSAIRLVEGTRLLQISAPVSPGSSGGPVVNERGEVIGLVVSGLRGGGAENLNFALPIEYPLGQLTLASSRAPEPLGGASPAMRRGTGRVTPSSERMNSDLTLGARAMHGLAYYTNGVDGDLDFSARTRYAVVPIDAGLQKLEQVEIIEYRTDRQTVFTVEATAFIALDGSSAGVSRQVRVLNPDYLNLGVSLEWIARDGSRQWTRLAFGRGSSQRESVSFLHG